jgi:hypothetical protein
VVPAAAPPALARTRTRNDAVVHRRRAPAEPEEPDDAAPGDWAADGLGDPSAAAAAGDGVPTAGELVRSAGRELLARDVAGPPAAADPVAGPQAASCATAHPAATTVTAEPGRPLHRFIGFLQLALTRLR